MQKYKELVELISWCKFIFNDSCTKIDINDVDVNLDEEITEELCKQISNSMDQDEEEWYDIFLFPDKLIYSDFYVVIMKSIPCDNVYFTISGDHPVDRVSIAFDDNVDFPEHCFINRLGSIEKYDISNYAFADLSNVPRIRATNLFFSHCSFPNRSLNGLTFTHVNRLELSYCGIETFGNGISPFLDMDLTIWESDIKLKTWSGIPKQVSRLMIGTSPDREDLKHVDGIVNVSYDPNLLTTLPKYVVSCSTLIWPFPSSGQPISILNTLCMSCNNLFLYYSNETSRRIANIVIKHFYNFQSGKQPNAILDCQEELIEMGFYNYAKI